MTKLLVEFILNSNCVLVLLRQTRILIILWMLQGQQGCSQAHARLSHFVIM